MPILQIRRRLAGIILMTAMMIPREAAASMIFIAANRTQIVVAADSRKTEGVLVDDRVCKIKLGIRGIFVVTGRYPTGLLEHIWATGQRLTNQHGTAAEHLRVIIEVLSTTKINPPLQRETRGAIAFVQMTADGPFVAGAHVTMKGERIAFKPKTEGDWRGGSFGAGYYILSADERAETNEAIESFLEERGAALPVLVDLATRAIRSQARIDASVGGPIDIAIIDATGTRWQNCKAECGQGCPR